MNQKFDFNDISIVPEILSKIRSRKEIIPMDSDNMLPLFVAPMDTVIDRYNYKKFKLAGLNVCTPRNQPVWDTDCFESISLEEFENYIKIYKTKYYYNNEKKRILVDVANGHMMALYNLCKEFSEHRYSDTHQLMVGNVANPETFRKYAELNIDYVRVGIGGGSACLTSANTGVHYPMASLITECDKIRKELGSKTKIVADGGFRSFDDIIKALAIGADYVMVGGIMNKTMESCSKIELFKFLQISENTANKIWDKFPILRPYMYKKFRGMSTKEVQKEWNKKVLTTSEGIVKYNKVEYRLEKWVENFVDYLKSAMSYTGSETLDEFRESDYIFITENSLHRFKK